MKKAVLNRSGGKDSAICLHKINKSGKFSVEYLLTTINEKFDRITMHGVRTAPLEEQARKTGIELIKAELPEMPSMEVYEERMNAVNSKIKADNIEHSIFGDIFLDDLRKYREEKAQIAGMIPLFPIWQKPTDKLIREFIDDGFKALVVCTNANYPDDSWPGRTINGKFPEDMPENVDPCGENGEFHTFVYDAPYFDSSIKFQKGEIVFNNYSNNGDQSEKNYDTGFLYLDLFPA